MITAKQVLTIMEQGECPHCGANLGMSLGDKQVCVKCGEKVNAEYKDKKKDEEVDVEAVIKELIDTSFSGDNDSQMKAVQLLKGIATSDDPKSNKFMKALDKAASAMDPSDF